MPFILFVSPVDKHIFNYRTFFGIVPFKFMQIDCRDVRPLIGMRIVWRY
jgi:hypothetical protein